MQEATRYTLHTPCTLFILNKTVEWVHTAPESVKRVKSIEQILVKNKMEAERLSQC